MNFVRSVTLWSLLVMGSITSALAASCGDNGIPFLDVSANDIFCSDATWARNAGVARGCTEPDPVSQLSDLCPVTAVTRAQMVLFLRRTAEATFPSVFMTESSAASAGLDGLGTPVCTTPVIPAFIAELEPTPPPNGDFLHATAVISLLGGASAADVQVNVSRSMDGSPFFAATTVGSIVTVPAGQWADATVLSVFTPNFQVDTRWRIDLTRAAGSATTGQLAGLRCQIKVIRSHAPNPPF